MPRQVIPVGFALALGLLVLIGAVAPVSPFLEAISSTLVAWAAMLAAFALLLGLVNLLSVHAQRIAQRDGNSLTSLVVLVSAAVTLVLTLPGGPSSDVSLWIFQNVYRPLEASFLAPLAFFIFSAAWRGLRARSLETLIVLAAALVVLLGQAPLGGFIAAWLPGAREWILNVPALAGMRGILIGVALGTIATALRLLMGIDRPYAD